MIYLEWAIAIIAMTLFALVFYGAILHACDRQSQWEQRQKEKKHDDQ